MKKNKTDITFVEKEGNKAQVYTGASNQKDGSL